MYDFDKINNRKGTGCIKWDTVEGGILPFTIADMDFTCPPEIIAAVNEVTEHGIFGYSVYDKAEMNKAVIDYTERWYNYTLTSEHLVYSPGIVPALGYLVEIMSEPGSAVLFMTPAYPPFFRRVKDTGRIVAECPLDNVDGYYSMNFERFEAELIKSGAKLFILCNPHNPTGRCWTETELNRMLDICKRLGVKIIADEIHRDLTRTGVKFTPFETVAEDYIESIVSCIAVSKTFNLAGLSYSTIVIHSEILREKWVQHVNRRVGVEEGNGSIAKAAVLAAYRSCDGWLTELRSYLDENMRTVKSFLEAELPKSVFTVPEATYLMWIDFSAYTGDENPGKTIADKTNVLMTGGNVFGGDGYRYMRFNVACPRALLVTALEKLKNLK